LDEFVKKSHLKINNRILSARAAIDLLSPREGAGRVIGIRGLLADVSAPISPVAIGDRVMLNSANSHTSIGEVIGFSDDKVQVMAFHDLDGVTAGAPVNWLGPKSASLYPSPAWFGRVIDPLGEPLDGKGPLLRGSAARAVRGSAIPANRRARVGPRIDLGVRALDLFTTCREGQRLGLFAGSGIGKSTLLAMLTRGADCDAVVISLVGERGREVREFIEDDLGDEGLAKAIAVVATSDAAPLMRRQCAYTAVTLAEYLRDEGLSVLLLMDSVTRFCFALREIGLSLGEPPATRGYPPSVFAELPRLLERAGPGYEWEERKPGQITGLFTVLVEGDDHNEPVADAVRGILDGHVVLDRRIAEAGRYPAVDVLRSLSRLASSCLDGPKMEILQRARAVLALYTEMSDMVRLGAYRSGTDAAVDEALRLTPAIERLLCQDKGEQSRFDDAFRQLGAILGMPDGP